MIYLLWEYSDLCDCDIIRGYTRDHVTAYDWVDEAVVNKKNKDGFRKYAEVYDITDDQ